MTDIINHPAHYESSVPFECIELARLYGFDWGNAIKYVWRHKSKHHGAAGALEDLGKAAWYISDALAHGMDVCAATDDWDYASGDEIQGEADRMLDMAIEDNVAGASGFWWAMRYHQGYSACVSALEELAAPYREEAPEAYERFQNALKEAKQ